MASWNMLKSLGSYNTQSENKSRSDGPYAGVMIARNGGKLEISGGENDISEIYSVLTNYVIQRRMAYFWANASRK